MKNQVSKTTKKISEDKFMSELVNLFLKANNEQDMEKLFHAILTPEELEQITKRWQIIKHLQQGNTQREVAEMLGISTAKVGRGSREIKYGNGIFQKLYQKIYAK